LPCDIKRPSGDDRLLLTDPIQAADADVARFAKLYPMKRGRGAEGKPILWTA
jgi:hypothetical protein